MSIIATALAGSKALLNDFAGAFGANMAQNSGGILSFLADRFLGLSKKEREANAFTAQQNQAAMDFEERMANQQMQFQADQSATQWQRGVADMQAAGLNPALAYGQGGASAMQGASSSGHAGASVTPGESLSDLLQLATLKPQIDLLKAQARRTNAEAAVGEADAETRGALNSAALSEKLQNVENLKAEKDLMAYQRETLLPAQTALMKAEMEAQESNKATIDANRVYVLWQNEYHEKTGRWPGLNASSFFWNAILGMELSAGPGHDLPPVTGAIPFGFPRN